MACLSIGLFCCSTQKSKIVKTPQKIETIKVEQDLAFHLKVKETVRSKDTQVDQYEYVLIGSQLSYSHQTSGVHRSKISQTMFLSATQLERIRLYFERDDGTLKQQLIAPNIKSTMGNTWVDIAFDYQFEGEKHTFLLQNSKDVMRKDLAYLTVKIFQERLDRYLQEAQ